VSFFKLPGPTQPMAHYHFPQDQNLQVCRYSLLYVKCR